MEIIGNALQVGSGRECLPNGRIGDVVKIESAKLFTRLIEAHNAAVAIEYQYQARSRVNNRRAEIAFLLKLSFRRPAVRDVFQSSFEVGDFRIGCADHARVFPQIDSAAAGPQPLRFEGTLEDISDRR